MCCDMHYDTQCPCKTGAPHGLFSHISVVKEKCRCSCSKILAVSLNGSKTLNGIFKKLSIGGTPKMITGGSHFERTATHILYSVRSR